LVARRPDVHTRLKPMNTPNNRHVHQAFTLCKTRTCVPVPTVPLFHARYLRLRREARPPWSGVCNLYCVVLATTICFARRCDASVAQGAGLLRHARCRTQSV